MPSELADASDDGVNRTYRCSAFALGKYSEGCNGCDFFFELIYGQLPKFKAWISIVWAYLRSASFFEALNCYLAPPLDYQREVAQYKIVQVLGGFGGYILIKIRF